RHDAHLAKACVRECSKHICEEWLTVERDQTLQSQVRCGRLCRLEHHTRCDGAHAFAPSRRQHDRAGHTRTLVWLCGQSWERCIAVRRITESFPFRNLHPEGG